MRFSPIKRFVQDAPEDLLRWIKYDLNGILKELYIGLSNLKFEENFSTFTWQGVLTTGQVLEIPHPFKKVPSGYIIFKQVGNAVVDASTTDWTNEVLYLRNNGAGTVTVTVLFFP